MHGEHLRQAPYRRVSLAGRLECGLARDHNSDTARGLDPASRYHRWTPAVFRAALRLCPSYPIICIDPDRNMARYCRPAIERTLFGTIAVVHSWGRMNTRAGENRTLRFRAAGALPLSHDHTGEAAKGLSAGSSNTGNLLPLRIVLWRSIAAGVGFPPGKLSIDGFADE
jgi:predicted DNA-binding WGR domain protein